MNCVGCPTVPVRWGDSSKMARPLFVMFLSTRKNQTIIHHVFLESLEIGIENFQILSMLFSYLHVAFTRNLGHRDAATAQKVMLSSSTCLINLFEISSANDQHLSEFMLVLTELMPFGMGSFAELMPFGKLAWPGGGCFPELAPIGMGSS